MIWFVISFHSPPFSPCFQPGDELCRVIKTYIDNYRPQLITELSGDFLLVVSW